MYKFVISLIIICISPMCMYSAKPQYHRSDSLKVMRILNTAKTLKSDTNMILYFANQLRGLPYVAKTLEKNSDEQLVVNLRQLDCTTLVENVLAFVLCNKNKKNKFSDFCNYLQMIRYKNGVVSYSKRLHYFSEWIVNNSRMGFVLEQQSPNPPFTKVQKLRIDYMSKHPQYYPMLVKNPSWVTEISSMENELNDREYRYIPKSEIANTAVFRSTIHNGDIIVITTNKSGLDTSHIGLAVWRSDGLHMLNASSVHHKVVEERMTLYTYMKRHPSQVGIRIVHIND